MCRRVVLLCAVCAVYAVWQQIVSFTTEPMTAVDALDEQKRSVAAVHSENRVRQLHKEVQVLEVINTIKLSNKTYNQLSNHTEQQCCALIMTQTSTTVDTYCYTMYKTSSYDSYQPGSRSMQACNNML
jgi:hypothetical protein